MLAATGRVVLALMAGGVFVGCGGEAVDCQPGQAAALVGGGSESTGFVVMSSGDAMTVVLGPQGLYMVTPSVRVQNMYPGEAGRVGNDADPLVEFTLVLDGEVIGGSAREHLGMAEGPDGAERLGVFTPFTPDLSTYIGRTVTVRVEVEDACGQTATAALDVVADQ
ncbi:MAG TPA: hypothetical protein VL172_16145 [Kofleriaceae bacterium]|jgi:hypothetical protein|nr:hypothetical protein [Kofleriaceae bacterium]